MTTLVTLTPTMQMPFTAPDEAEVAAAAFLARYSGRTLDAYRHDLRTFFQWAADVGLSILEATRPEIELYRAALEARGLAPSTIDRRLSTVCGYYRFAHIDGRIASNPAQYVRGRRSIPQRATAWTEASWERSCSRRSALTARTPRSPCCWDSTASG